MAGRPVRRYRMLAAELADLDDVLLVLKESEDWRAGQEHELLAGIRESYAKAPLFGTEAAYRAQDARFQRGQRDAAPVKTKARALWETKRAVNEIGHEFEEERAPLVQQRARIVSSMEALQCLLERRGRWEPAPN